MTSHCITWHDTTQAITSHQMTWPSHDLTPQQTSRHQNTSLQSTKHHHHGTAEGSFTAKKWFGHRAGRSPCAHSIGKFFLCYIVLFLLETSAPGLSGYYWYYIHLLMLGKSGLFLPLATTTNDCVASCYSYCYSYSVCYPYYWGYKYYYYSYYQHHHPFFNVLHLLLPPLFDFLPVFRFLCIQIVFWPMHYYNRCWR